MKTNESKIYKNKSMRKGVDEEQNAMLNDYRRSIAELHTLDAVCLLLNQTTQWQLIEDIEDIQCSIIVRVLRIVGEHPDFMSANDRTYIEHITNVLG